jgi:DNA-binding beta-propeller fold protein YncE
MQLALVLMMISPVSTLSAEVPQVSPTFPNGANDGYAEGQLLMRQVGLGRTTNIVYHNGIVYTHNVGGSGRRQWEWLDSNDAGSLTNTIDDDNITPPFSAQGSHAHTKVGDWVGGDLGLKIKRDGVNVNINQSFPWSEWFQPSPPPEAQGGLTRIYYPWTVAFNWAYGAHNGQTFIYRGDDLLANWNALSQHGVSGTSIIMGNILFVLSDQSDLGLLAYDISPIFDTPAGNPVLLDKLSGNFGAYFPVLWENYILLALRGSNDQRVDIVDWSDPTNLRFVTSIDLTGTPELDGNQGVPYPQSQDNFIFVRHHKVDMDTFEIALELDQVGNNRPAGSVSGELETSQYLLPVGRYLISGGYSFSGQDGVGVWVHQSEPDTKRPYVGYHMPRPGQTNFPLGAPISLLVHETLESFTIINGETVILRPVGGNPIDCYVSHSHDDILTITPKQYLQPDTTYEVLITDGGIKDAAGNGIEPYSFTFSTGNAVSGGNQAPIITSFTAAPSPTPPGSLITLSASATDLEADPLEYRFTFGDASPATGWSSSNWATVIYPAEGHYEAKVQVRDLKPDGTTSASVKTRTVTIANEPSGPAPTKSSPITLDENRRRVFVVNPDNNTLSMIDADSLTLQWEVFVGEDPRSVALDNFGNAWVTCNDAHRIEIRSGSTGALINEIDTGYGTSPVGVAPSPDGLTMYVTLEGSGELVRYATASQSEEARIVLGPWAHAIAVTGDGSRVLVSRFISTESYGVIWDVNSNGDSLNLTRLLPLYRDRGDPGKDGGSAGEGVPNYISSITITPDNTFAWYTAKKDDTERGEFFDQGTGFNEPLTPDHTVRAMVGRISLSSNDEPSVTNESTNIRLDVDNAEGPTAVTFSPLGDYAWVSMRGNDLAAVYDRLLLNAGGTKSTIARIPSGKAPTGVIVDPLTERLWIKNFMSRDVTVHELSGFLTSGDRTQSVMTVPTVLSESLDPQILLGKQIFYNAGGQVDPNNHERMSREGYLSCATCHIDGSHDGRTFDFTQRGEGLRNTIDLRGRAATGQGNVHWTANFDEIQDFENDIRLAFGGAGFMSDADFAATEDPLGAPKAGLSLELDALAAYVSSLAADSLPDSPHRNAEGSMTAEALNGSAIFSNEDCESCHNPATGYTDSELGSAPTLHHVGTTRTSSGSRTGQALLGLDTPTLLGVWNTAPYFHDGSAETLADVFAVTGGEVIQAETASLGGGAFVPGWIDYSMDGTSHGALVKIRSVWDTVTFTSVDGGTGGVGAVELRYTTSQNGTIRVTINGTVYDLAVTDELTRLEWKRLRIENVNFNGGLANTIIVETPSGLEFMLDEITVSTPDDLAQAYPHRRVLNLVQQDFDDLIAYLLQLRWKPPTYCRRRMRDRIRR